MPVDVLCHKELPYQAPVTFRPTEALKADEGGGYLLPVIDRRVESSRIFFDEKLKMCT